jgi:hypothetical protein
MEQWVIDAENLLSGSWVEVSGENKEERALSQRRSLTNEEVARRFDAFLHHHRQSLTKDEMSQTERECLEEFLRVLTNLRPHLIQCYDLAVFPRTNNEMEGSIRKTKARYRRISGRKNWNTYLLRHGRNVAFYDWWQANSERWHRFQLLAQKIDHASWKKAKQETRSSQNEQLKRFRFLHRRSQFLTTLEDRWTATSGTGNLH